MTQRNRGHYDLALFMAHTIMRRIAPIPDSQPTVAKNCETPQNVGLPPKRKYRANPKQTAASSPVVTICQKAGLFVCSM
jgi:hypothetical protein